MGMLGNPGSMRRVAHLVVTCSPGSCRYRKDGVDYQVVKRDDKYLLQMKLLDADEWDTVLVSRDPFL